MAESKKQTSALDAFIGDKVKLRRSLLGMSQERLGELLGLTFQQVQKYEKGINRISAGRLFEVSVRLGCPITYFYDGLTLAGETSQGFAEENQNSEIMKFVTSTEGLQLATAFMQIKDSKVRKNMLDLLKSMGAASKGIEKDG